MMKKVIRNILVFIIIVWLCNRLYLAYFDKTFTKDEIEGWFESITSKYGIKIVYEIKDDFFSDAHNPLTPAGPDRRSSVKPIEHRVLSYYPDILINALGKYPVEVVKGHLRGIHFAAKIEYAGLSYGGSYDPFRKIIYLVDHGRIAKDDAVSTFHHEFSSLLRKRQAFFITQWTDKHPNSFRYLDEIHDSIKSADKARDTFSDKDCYRLGIVTNYGLTCFGNDFSEYSAMIFTYPQKFKKIMKQYPRIRAKFLVWLEFYQKIDPIFTEAYLLGDN